MASEVKLKPCPFCGGRPDVTDWGVTSFLIESDGGLVGSITCANCATSVTCSVADAAAKVSDFGCRRIHPIDLWNVAQATMDKWNRRANDE